MSWLSLELAPNADERRGRAALEASDAGPAGRVGAVLSAGTVPIDGERTYVASTPLGTLRSDRVRSLLATGLVPRRFSGSAASAYLWAGSALESIVAGVRRESILPSVVRSASVSLSDVEDAIRAAVSGKVVRYDRTLGARALVGLLRAHDEAPTLIQLSCETAFADAAQELPEIFDAYLLHADVPTVSGFESFVIATVAQRLFHVEFVAATGAEALFGFGEAARLAGRRSRPRLLRRRFRPAADSLDVDGSRAAEIAGLAGAPIHRVSSILAVLPTQTRDAVAHFGPRDVPSGLSRDAHVASVWSEIASLDDAAGERSSPAGLRVLCPFVRRDIRELAHRLPPSVRFGRLGSGGPLARWAATDPVRSDVSTTSSDERWDAACRGALRSRIEAAMGAAAQSPVFHAEGVTTALARFRAGTHGWTGRRIATIALLAGYLERERLEPEPSG